MRCTYTLHTQTVCQVPGLKEKQNTTANSLETYVAWRTKRRSCVKSVKLVLCDFTKGEQGSYQISERSCKEVLALHTLFPCLIDDPAKSAKWREELKTGRDAGISRLRDENDSWMLTRLGVPRVRQRETECDDRGAEGWWWWGGCVRATHHHAAEGLALCRRTERSDN